MAGFCPVPVFDVANPIGISLFSRPRRADAAQTQTQSGTRTPGLQQVPGLLTENGRPRPVSGLRVAAVLLLISLAGWGLSMYIASQYAIHEGKSNRRALLYTLRLESEIKAASSPAEVWEALTIIEAKYPPLFYIPALLSRTISPFSDDRLASLQMMVFFFMALNCGFYLLLRVRLKSRWALLGTALFSLSPGILFAAKVYSPTFPCVAMLALALGISARLKPFERWPDTLALAAVCGAGPMVFYSMPVFLAGPVIFSFILALREKPNRQKKVLALSVFFLLVVALICAPYYLSDRFIYWANSRLDIFFLQEGEAGAQDYPTHLRALYWIAHYSVALVIALWLFSLPLMLLMSALGFQALLPRPRVRRLWLRPNHVGGMLTCTVLISLVFFSLYGTKNLDYVLPLLPVFAYPFCVTLSADFLQKRRTLAVGLAVTVIILGAAFSMISCPRFPQRLLDSVTDPIVQKCREADPPCLVVVYYCSPFDNVFLQVNRGWDPQRMWISNPPAPEDGGPAAESIDFILVEKGKQSLSGSTLNPFNPPCAIIPELDPQTGEVRRLLHYGRDVTGLFQVKVRADGSDKSLILYDRK